MSDGQTESQADHPPVDPARTGDRPADRRHDRALRSTDDGAASVLPFPSLGRRGDAHAADPSPRLRDVIGDVLRDERRRQGRTLADVAERAAVSLPYLSEIERGRKDISSDLLDAIGRSLDLPLPDLLERAVDRLRVDGRRLRHQGGSSFQLRAA